MTDVTSSEQACWLGFSAFPGIGPLRFKLLLQFFGSGENAWKASERELVKIGLGEKLTQKFSDFRNTFSLPKYLEEIKKKEIHVITLRDKEYPSLLAQIPDPPFLLYVRGDLTTFARGPLTKERNVAVVGTRKVTHYGEEVTRKITQGLVDAGCVIVSGMAYGVDAVAHETAIEGGGKTIAVLGCGVDMVHPKANSTIYWKIVEGAGLVISEFPVGRFAEKGLFPARNRIISGLSLGILVTEGAGDSGALITARYAAEQGREVFAVPGPITSVFSQAPTLLLKQGAKLVTEAKDILEELNIKHQRSNIKNKNQKANIDLTKEEEMILILLEGENLHFDEIVRKSKRAASAVGSLLTIMEMKGYVKHLPAGVYQVAIDR